MNDINLHYFNETLIQKIQKPNNYIKFKMIMNFYNYLDDYYKNSLLPIEVSYLFNNELTEKNLIIKNTFKGVELLLIKVKSNEIIFFDSKGKEVERLSFVFDDSDFRNRISNYIEVYFNSIKTIILT